MKHSETAFCGIGYLLWLIDFFACPVLQTIRTRVGLPWGFLFELHGWYVLIPPPPLPPFRNPFNPSPMTNLTLHSSIP